VRSQQRDQIDQGAPSTSTQTAPGIRDRIYDKFDHNALLAEYEEDYHKDAAFEAG
jgi:hypothetical protein